MSLEVLDEGRQKPVPARRRVISPSRAMIQKVILRFKNRRIARTPVGLVNVEPTKVIADRCMPKDRAGHAGHEAWISPFVLSGSLDRHLTAHFL